MASVLEIIIKAKDMATREIAKFDNKLKETAKDADKLNDKVKETDRANKGVVGSFTELHSMVSLVQTGLQYASAAYQALITDTVEYGKQVDDLSRALGTSTEEASKLIQVADDLRIEYGQLKTAFRIALRQGVTPNIEGMKDLAQEYQQLRSPAERAQFALEKFGRSGLEMQKILELDAAALDEMAQGAEDAGLVLSKDAVEATKEFYKETDNLGDSIEGLKVQLGIALIPALTESLTGFNMQITAIRQLKQSYKDKTITLGEYNKMMYEQVLMGKDLIEVLETLEERNASLREAEEDEISTKQRFITAMNTTGDAAWGAYYALDGMPHVTAAMADAFAEEGARAAKELADKLLEINRASGEAIAGLREFEKQKIEDFFDVDIDPGRVAQQLFDVTAFREAGGESINAYIESVKTALAQGKITPDQAQEFFGNAVAEAENLQVELGKIDAGEAAENISKSLSIPIEDAKKLLDDAKASADTLGATKFEALTAEFDALQLRKEMLIGASELDPENQIVIAADPNDVASQRLTDLETQLINMTSKVWAVDIQVNKPDIGGGGGTGGGGGGGGRRRKQYGGYVSPMTPYLVGERGPELFVPNAAGNIVPNNRLRGGGGARGDVYVTQHFHSAGAAALGMAWVEEARGKRLDAGMGG